MQKEFEVYTQELIEWNKKFNLTRITDPKEIHLKHFEDSLTVLQAVKLINQSVADVGTGAGFPGIPLKIVCPDIKLTLIEATKKKTTFLEHVVKILGLKDVEIIWGRAEDLKDRKFDLVVARAVAKLPKLAQYCLPIVKSGGIFVAMKGQDIAKELKEAEGTIKLLGGKSIEAKNIQLPNSDIIRTLIVVNKV
ncbi:16S rRNA (guanine(527)-N(7))-methyltransferase RsmG [candidate division WOR-1 bacterium RIFOXYB2_FULL_42_35]|uniref:Ribosomal RNA small subunit methyltransferase G n=1 Tax=candidate division WOR-1 bacterium RIFOXYC2_FULL_41_25 TaxID=1802586 RepID=A0A1F4TJV8_UNCSA|nr:MAG: 16S rRNA (guanine(527)-N(7))-methyltransferase RsmG [candidate division WOR-1 bacterium RIFOXYA2_FULL_41_14]OGC23479.1 MAG: 16S rRNA (guanine(527)-N(7))-methyltransferase RsmG [candidate division WOR-1 bacterium RIFOXYB2_FULL_42_35]OGC33002.1 MAG: 16S rRNA (guanine(527)-N(7))-methyltransferase RsmG [candidate division WOR-1 bacterium RIFOXYC2_FULL_41_25]OGC44121.1 MAG: 16S rRNA (guanine(527)-N(7))-methyltransferase RsmG [candidate division WOR-1 bacterium RIFOXYD2_FULL_41_8]